MGAGPADSGIYKSYYMLQEPVDQMRDFITDALRSSIPVYTLDEVFAKKDDIAKDVNATVSEQMAAYGFTLVSTLITKIALPTEVENSMNDINAAQRKRAAAQELAEADRIKRVTEASNATASTTRWSGRSKDAISSSFGASRRIPRSRPCARPSRWVSKIRSRSSKRRVSAMTRPTNCSCLRSGPR